MPINNIVFSSPATKGEVALMAITVAGALNDVSWALAQIKRGKDIDEELIVRLDMARENLHQMFDELTGYKNE